MARLLLVRHGETEGQSSLRFWGRTDVALDRQGELQAEKLKARLADEAIESIYSSPLKRAQQTASIIVAEREKTVLLCPELREIDFGDMEGLNFGEIQERFPQVAALWSQRSARLVYPGGESLTSMERRVARFAARLETDQPAGTVLIVAHAGILRSLICRLLGLAPRHRWNMRLDLASLSIVETFPEISILNLLNDTCHLENHHERISS